MVQRRIQNHSSRRYRRFVLRNKTIIQGALVNGSSNIIGGIGSDYAIFDDRIGRGAPNSAATYPQNVGDKSRRPVLQGESIQARAIGQPRASNRQRPIRHAISLNARLLRAIHASHRERLVQSHAIGQVAGHHFSARDINSVRDPDGFARRRRINGRLNVGGRIRPTRERRIVRAGQRNKMIRRPDKNG